MKFSLKKPVIYVVRDLERALGLPLATRNYYIISNSTPFANSFIKNKKNVLLIKNKELLDTRDLLQDVEVIKFINKINNAQILVFKNTSQIEKICLEHDWKLLNPPAELSSKIEEKISQVEWLGDLKKYLPPFQIKIAKLVKWSGEKFILQFNRAHTGNGTILIENENQLKEIQTKFPNREVRISKYIKGPVFTNNNIVWGNKILCGNINYQITGLKPFTNLPFATIGNDWALPHKILTVKQKKEYEKMAQEIGKKMMKSGWKGLFGIDVVCDEKSGKLYLIEINARQPASTSFESQLQANVILTCLGGEESLTTFQAHLLSVLEQKYDNQKLIKITDGAQITQKVMSTANKLQNLKIENNFKRFEKMGYKIVLYNNTDIEADWVRIQSSNGIMKAPNFFNKKGSELGSFHKSI